MKKMKWWAKLLIGLLCAALIFVVLVYFAFEGSLIKRIIVTHQVKEYVAEHFPDQELRVDFARFDWKASSYYCDVWSETSVDTNFWVGERQGSLDDSYQERVTERGATYYRLQDEAGEEARRRMSEGYPHDFDHVNCLFESVEGWDPSQLTLDMENPPFPLDLYISFVSEDDQLSADFMKERLRELPEIVDALNMNISYFSMSIYGEDEQSTSLHCFNVPREIVLSNQLDAYIDAELNR